MGLAANQARLNVLTCKKADLEYRLTILASHEQVLVSQKSEAVTAKSKALAEFIDENNADANVKFENTQASMDYEKAMAEIEAADERLTQQRKAAETELHSVEAEQEEVGKLVSSNIKSSFGYFN